MISNSVDSPFDILRLHSICKSWHAALPPLLKFPYPFVTGKDIFLSETTIYRLKTLHGTYPPISYLVRVDETYSSNSSQIANTTSKSYADDSFSVSLSGVNKVIRYPGNDYSILVIFDGGKLGFAKYGDQQLTLVDDRITNYQVITLYKGEPYVVDQWGIVSMIELDDDDSSLKLTNLISSPPCGDIQLNKLRQKHFVVSCRKLYVV
ncbi:hypothetical protein FEM48_Zijuj08G0081800 [Ziziphus jujuba var. spinosa]|uniref:Uncharacterized protein n=1 Tax=Ziziphus jujuba var. spinosa TaxID=714518 RepID=A0A978UXZ2_ZIZJJ|nr:hypothetical protein FEM48_Zijuj08G0081800 [Ziziphus jujuba var. spinosa]